MYSCVLTAFNNKRISISNGSLEPTTWFMTKSAALPLRHSMSYCLGSQGPLPLLNCHFHTSTRVPRWTIVAHVVSAPDIEPETEPGPTATPTSTQQPPLVSQVLLEPPSCSPRIRSPLHRLYTWWPPQSNRLPSPGKVLVICGN